MGAVGIAAAAPAISATGGGDGVILPGSRVVALYGAPQIDAVILGRVSPGEAQRRLRRTARRYRRVGDLPVEKAFDLIAVIASASPGADGDYRYRQRKGVIRRWLHAAREIDARLILDIQPGRSSFIREVKALREWLRKPRVDVALDPEWAVGPGEVPGQTLGSVGSRMVNRVSKYLVEIVRNHDLPQKLLMVHQFYPEAIRHDGRLKQRGENVALILDFDGFGTPREKRRNYERLARREHFNGFTLFYRRDEPLMRPRQVLRLRPEPEFVMYE